MRIIAAKTPIWARLKSAARKSLGRFFVLALTAAVGTVMPQGPSGTGPSSTNPVPGAPSPAPLAPRSPLAAVGCAVGYRTDQGSNTGQAGVITAAGGVPVAIGALTGFAYGTIKVLWVDEASNGTPSADFTSAVPAIASFVAGGGIFVYNSRNVTQGASDAGYLPGGSGIALTNSFGAAIDVATATPLTSGPFGTITNNGPASLDGGTFSNHGYAATGSLPAGSTVELIVDGAPGQAVGFSYRYGSGGVYYAAIPLDYYLNGGGPVGVRANFDTVYAPNMIAWACSGLIGASCPDHTVHGHVVTTPPDGHDGDSHAHHAQHGHHLLPGSECLPAGHHVTVNGHILGLTPESTDSAIPSALTREPDFVAALNQDGLNAPAAPGTIVQLFGSAKGLFLDPADLRPALGFTPAVSGSPLYFTESLPEVQIGGAKAEVLFSGLAPGLKGVWQINLRIPDGMQSGKVPVTISYDGDTLTSIDLTVE